MRPPWAGPAVPRDSGCAAMKRAVSGLAALAVGVAGCGGDSEPPPTGDDRGAGVGALGGAARVETLAKTRLVRPPKGELVWVADEFRLAPGERLAHAHEQAFLYVRRGRLAGGAAEGDGAAVRPRARHTHRAGDEGAVLWEIRLARPGSKAAEGATRRVFESQPLEGVPAPAEVSFLEVTVPPRGGRTTVHTHPGPELIYQLSGRIDYQNAIDGAKRVGPGGLEGIPPDTAVQKRNPYARPATFLSWFLVDPDAPFAPKASF
jgi:quercetin dioxygenase-like cupin family protein